MCAYLMSCRIGVRILNELGPWETRVFACTLLGKLNQTYQIGHISQNRAS